MGRPSSYTEEIAAEICGRIAEGESLLKICADDHLPNRSTVHEWIVADREGFASKYARAKDACLDLLAEEIIQIADTPEIGQKTVSKATGLEVTEGDMVEHRRLKIDARKWYLSKVAPKKYGEKIAIGGADDLPPVKTLGDEALAERIKQLQEKVNGSSRG